MSSEGSGYSILVNVVEDEPAAPPPTPVNPAAAAQASESAQAEFTGLLQQAEQFLETGVLGSDVGSINTEEADDFLRTELNPFVLEDSDSESELEAHNLF